MPLFKKLKNFLRVPFTQGLSTPMSIVRERETPQDAAAGRLGEIEKEVIHRICNLASLVRLEVDAPEGSQYKRFEKQISEKLTLAHSIRQYVYLSLLNQIVSIVILRHNNMITQVKFFADSNQVNADGTIQFVDDFAGHSNVITVPVRDVAQVTAYPFSAVPSPIRIRKLENEYWQRVDHLNKIKGLITTNKMDMKQIVGKTKQEQAFLKVQEEYYRDSAIGFMPKEHEFQSYVNSQTEKLNELRENVLESYCNHYGIPSPLYYVEVGTHTDITLSSAYKQFKLATLEPLMDTLSKVIESYIGHEVRINYDKIQLSSAKENLEYSQAKFLKINEMRKINGFPPDPDGDRFTEGAGAAGEEKEKKEGDATKKKKDSE